MSEAIGVDAAFEIEAIQNAALKVLIEKYGKENVRFAWGLGYLSGQMTAFQRAGEIMK